MIISEKEQVKIYEKNRNQFTPKSSALRVIIRDDYLNKSYSVITEAYDG